jgi:hypothetical protein
MNNEELDGGIHFDLAQFIDKFDINKYFIGINYLYTEENKNKNYNSMIDLSFLLLDRMNFYKSLKFGIGFKTLYLEKDETSFVAIPITTFSSIETKIFGILTEFSGTFHYSPQSLTFKNGYRYSDYRLQIAFNVIQRGKLIFGYRNIKANFINGSGFNETNIDEKFSNGIFFGFELGF